MDGTLIDSGDVISNTINFVRKNIGLDTLPKKILLSNINNPDIDASSFFYGTSAFTDEQTKLFGEYYDRNCINNIKLYDNIKDMLESINNHFILTVATNASVEFANKMLKHLKIDKYFDMVIGANNVPKAKPHPDMLLKTLETFNIEEKYSLLVGDSHKDKRAAQNANIDCMLVNWGFTNHSEEESIATTNELHNKLLKLKEN